MYVGKECSLCKLRCENGNGIVNDEVITIYLSFILCCMGCACALCAKPERERCGVMEVLKANDGMNYLCGTSQHEMMKVQIVV